MDRLEMAITLIKEAQEEKNLIHEYETDRKRAYQSRDWNTFYSKWPREPRKSVVNDNLKMARRFLLDEYMN